MAEDFDAELSRLFSAPPAFSDGEAFAARVTNRLERNWSMRRVMIGIGGLAAGVVVAWQFLAGRFNLEMASISSDARTAMNLSVGRLTHGLDQFAVLPAGGETMWLAAALAAVALAFGVTRAAESF